MSGLWLVVRFVVVVRLVVVFAVVLVVGARMDFSIISVLVIIQGLRKRVKYIGSWFIM